MLPSVKKEYSAVASLLLFLEGTSVRMMGQTLKNDSAPEGGSGLEELVMDEVQVRAGRLPATGLQNPFAVRVIDHAVLTDSPGGNLDDVLRQEVPGFSLFRRSGSQVAHPTTQGVSLRNLGPNGAGRTLVMLDGMPLNDPFGGDVNWQRIPVETLDKVFVTRGGGAGLFGNAALAGTIQLESQDPETSGVELGGRAGNRETFEESFKADWVEEAFGFSLLTRHSETGGYPIVRNGDRGSLDGPAWSENDLWNARLTWRAAPHTRLEINGSGFQEERGNGTPGAGNSSDAWDVGAALIQSFPGLEAELRLQAYYQNRRFSSTFTSVNEARSAETPALDQFRVPSESAGGSATWSQRVAERHRVVAGMDFRRVEGETNERFRYMNNRFTRERRAGGRQEFAGGFLEDTWEVSPGIAWVAGVRLDYVRQTDGGRRESDTGSGVVLVDELYTDRAEWRPDGRLALSVSIAEQLKWRSAVYTGFRQPTLNEFYRPFRIGNEITEANPLLDAEELLGAETGFDWTPGESVEAGVTGFYNRISDAVGNVTLGQGPGTFQPGGFVPAGGVLRQRRNLDRITVWGFESSVVWKPSSRWRMGAQYLFTHAVVEKSDEARELEGRRLEQSPAHVGAVSMTWKPDDRWALTLQSRFSGSQFEDDLNTEKLRPYAVVDAAVDFEATRNLSLDLKVENLFDTTIETGKSGNGLVSIGAPLLISVGARYRF
ncbi:MAG: putative TonB-dependent receptor [Verrucomicrobiales bacterium]|nr:putative TonB-dependent receptor [Verrucomicrobiales bacterium]